MRRLSRIVIRGRVQGVGFRAWIMRRAESRGIDGWARNRPDGSVEAVLAGQEEHILALISECREGPGSSIVTDVIEVTGAEDPGSGFRITA